MNAILEAIVARRSIKQYKGDMVPADVIDQVINAGLYAASAMGSQCPIIIAVTNKALRDKLSRINCKIGGWDASFDPFYNAPVVLVVVAPKSFVNRVYDGSLVIGNMLLAAHALGIGSCWIHRARETFESPEGKEILASLGLHGEYEGIGNCVIGYPAGPAPEAKPRKENRVIYAR